MDGWMDDEILAFVHLQELWMGMKCDLMIQYTTCILTDLYLSHTLSERETIVMFIIIFQEVS